MYVYVYIYIYIYIYVYTLHDPHVPIYYIFPCGNFTLKNEPFVDHRKLMIYPLEMVISHSSEEPKKLDRLGL